MRSVPFTLTMQSDLKLVCHARGFVEAVCQFAGLDPQLTSAIVLATHEAANNVIRHAHLGRPDAELQIDCYLSPDCIEIHVHDEGDPFDLDSVPELDPGELRIGGRGLFLMRRLMDELTCHRRADRGNTIRMVKRRAPLSPCVQVS